MITHYKTITFLLAAVLLVIISIYYFAKYETKNTNQSAHTETRINKSSVNHNIKNNYYDRQSDHNSSNHIPAINKDEIFKPDSKHEQIEFDDELDVTEKESWEREVTRPLSQINLPSTTVVIDYNKYRDLKIAYINYKRLFEGIEKTEKTQTRMKEIIVQLAEELGIHLITQKAIFIEDKLNITEIVRARYFNYYY